MLQRAWLTKEQFFLFVLCFTEQQLDSDPCDYQTVRCLLVSAPFSTPTEGRRVSRQLAVFAFPPWSSPSICRMATAAVQQVNDFGFFLYRYKNMWVVEKLHKKIPTWRLFVSFASHVAWKHTALLISNVTKGTNVFPKWVKTSPVMCLFHPLKPTSHCLSWIF